MARPYRVALFTIAVVALVALAVLTAKPLLVLFGGVLFALVLSRLARVLTRVTRLGYRASVALVVALLVALVGAFVVSVGPAFREQLVELATTMPAVARSLYDRVMREPIGQAVGAPAAQETATGAVRSGAAIAVGTTLEVLGALIVIFFVGVYGAARPGDYAKVVLALTPPAHRDRARVILDEVATTLTRWLIGRLVSMTFVGVTCGIAFSLLQVPLALTLAVVAGLLTFIEYIGAIASAVPPLLLALTKGPTTALAVLIVYSVLHVVDGYVLTPLITRVSGRLAPGFTLASQILLGALVGPLGLTFSTPLLIVGVGTARGWRRSATGDAVSPTSPATGEGSPSPAEPSTGAAPPNPQPA